MGLIAGIGRYRTHGYLLGISEDTMSIKRKFSEKRSERDTFLGIKCSGNSKESHVETETIMCDVCGAVRVIETEVIELLHVPTTLHNARDAKGPMINCYYWGYKKNSFDACKTHSETELDTYVAFLKSGVP